MIKSNLKKRAQSDFYDALYATATKRITQWEKRHRNTSQSEERRPRLTQLPEVVGFPHLPIPPLPYPPHHERKIPPHCQQATTQQRDNNHFCPRERKKIFKKVFFLSIYTIFLFFCFLKGNLNIFLNYKFLKYFRPRERKKFLKKFFFWQFFYYFVFWKVI